MIVCTDKDQTVEETGGAGQDGVPETSPPEAAGTGHQGIGGAVAPESRGGRLLPSSWRKGSVWGCSVKWLLERRVVSADCLTCSPFISTPLLLSLLVSPCSSQRLPLSSFPPTISSLPSFFILHTLGSSCTFFVIAHFKTCVFHPYHPHSQARDPSPG